jgi:hypothetical protein
MRCARLLAPVVASIWAAAFTLAAGAACYSPSLLDCTITCGAGGACPSGSSCGADGLCHTGAADHCTIAGGEPDALETPGEPDAHEQPGPPDAAPGKPDARPSPTPDAPPSCEPASVGEPDDSCPGESIGPVAEGKTLTLTDRLIYPAKDVDVYRVPLKLNPIASCPISHSVSYAIRVNVSGPQGMGTRLGRFEVDRVCAGTTKSVGTSYCIQFPIFCTGPPTEAPVYYFAVDQSSNNAVCAPYTLSVQVCAAGSTCDNCKTL